MKDGEVKVWDNSAEVLKTVMGLTAARFKEFTQTIVDIGKEEAPIDTGELMKSISHDSPRGDLTRRIFTQTGYGGYVHEGHMARNGKHLPGNPFIARAIDRALPEFQSSGPWV